MAKRKGSAKDVRGVEPSRAPASKLVPCPACGHEVSRRAVGCPECGAPLGDERSPNSPQVSDSRDLRVETAPLCLHCDRKLFHESELHEGVCWNCQQAHPKAATSRQPKTEVAQVARRGWADHTGWSKVVIVGLWSGVFLAVLGGMVGVWFYVFKERDVLVGIGVLLTTVLGGGAMCFLAVGYTLFRHWAWFLVTLLYALGGLGGLASELPPWERFVSVAMSALVLYVLWSERKRFDEIR